MGEAIERKWRQQHEEQRASRELQLKWEGGEGASPHCHKWFPLLGAGELEPQVGLHAHCRRCFHPRQEEVRGLQG